MEQCDQLESSSHYSVADMSEGIISGHSETAIMTAFQNSGLSLEHLTEWRHPALSLNIFQFAILYQRPGVVKSLGNLCPFFYTERSLYKLSLTSLNSLASQQDRSSGELEFEPAQNDQARRFSDFSKQAEAEASQCSHGENVKFLSLSVTAPTPSPSSAEKDSDSDTVLLNSPLHLACMVGSVDCIKYLLENTCSYYLNQVGYVSIAKNEGTTSLSCKYKALPWSESRKGKPFEICVASAHIDCVFYFLNNVIIYCLALRFLYAGVREPSSMLHKACSIGCGPLVKLLLENSFRDVISLSDKNGKTPLHIAVWNGNTETIKHLLDSGASVNAVTESKGCLHILFRSKLHPNNYVTNTKLLMKYGINVHITDSNGKSALHILAEEIGISRSDVMRYWKRASDAIRDMTSSQDRNLETYTMETYQSDLVTCLELLLNKGMNPNRVTSKSAFNETVLEVLLQYSSLQYRQKTLWNSPDLIYRAVGLLLSHNANPNMPRRCGDMSMFTYFIMNHLNNIEEDEMKHKFVHLFSLYGADMDRTAMNSCYPVVAAVEKQTPPIVVELMVNLMDICHFQQAVMTLQERPLPGLMYSGKAKEVEYAENIVEVFQRLRMRSLRHFCKVAILGQLMRPIEGVHQLPLPKYLKDYITSDKF